MHGVSSLDATPLTYAEDGARIRTQNTHSYIDRRAVQPIQTGSLATALILSAARIDVRFV